MFHPAPHPAAHAGPQPPPNAELSSPLPRGECRFILLHPEITGQRCSCQGFWLNKRIPGSSCECGHQACYHVPEPPAASATAEEHLRLAEKVRKLSEQLDDERAEREEEVKQVYRAIQGVYSNISGLQRASTNKMVDFEDKLEGAIDRTQGLWEELKTLKEKVVGADDATMDLELRVEELEADAEVESRPQRRTDPRRLARTLKDKDGPKIKTEGTGVNDTSPKAWDAEVTFVPLPFPSFIYDRGGVADKRCRSRGLRRTVTVNGLDNRSFSAAVESAFSDVLKNRRWMPLFTQTTSINETCDRSMLQRLSDDQCCSDLWDPAFLKNICASRDNNGAADAIFITLRDHNLSWEEIKRLTPVRDFDQSCWDHNEQTDGILMEDEALDLGASEELPSPPIFASDPAALDDRSPLELLASLASMPMKRQISELDRTLSGGGQGQSRKRKKAASSTL